MVQAKLLFLNSSVALIAENQMPQVNHDFLVNREIIPRDFVTQSGSVNIPPLSQVQYKNGFQITVERNSKALFQVSFHNKSESVISSDLTLLQQVSVNFINCFQNIPYQAIGINFDVIGEDLEYDSFIQKIINSDSTGLKFEDNEADINSMHLSYKIGGKQLNVQILKMEATDIHTKNTRFIPLFKINMHYLQGYSDDKVSIIKEVEDNYKLSKKFVERFYEHLE